MKRGEFCCVCGCAAEGTTAVIHGGTEVFGGEFDECEECGERHCSDCGCVGTSRRLASEILREEGMFERGN